MVKKLFFRIVNLVRGLIEPEYGVVIRIKAVESKIPDKIRVIKTKDTHQNVYL